MVMQSPCLVNASALPAIVAILYEHVLLATSVMAGIGGDPVLPHQLQDEPQMGGGLFMRFRVFV